MPTFNIVHKAKGPRAPPKQAEKHQHVHDNEPQPSEKTPTFDSGHKAKGPEALPKQAEQKQKVHDKDRSNRNTSLEDLHGDADVQQRTQSHEP